MGVDYTAALVYGAVIKMKRVPTVVTRYNEITGDPYEKETYDYQYVVGDTDIIFDRDAIPEELHDTLCDSGRMFLTDSTGYLGIQLASVDPRYGESQAINPAAFDSAEQQYLKLVEDTFGAHSLVGKALLANGQLELVGVAW